MSTTRLHATYFGTATVLLEIEHPNGTFRLLTDPVFDDPGTTYHLGPFAYTRLAGAAARAESLPHIDLVLLSHDHHGDNLDAAGRQLAKRADALLTTPAGARRLGRAGIGRAQGLAPWQKTEVRVGDFTLTVTATPARHGPPLSLPIVGPVTGFLVEWTGQSGGPLWISGDTVWHRALRPLADRRIDVALLHVGSAGVRNLRLLRVSMDGKDAALAAQVLAPRVICPVHFEGWSHFQEGRDRLRAHFEGAKLDDRCVWLPAGSPVVLAGATT